MSAQPTQWIVITGAPCAGKTTLIEAFHARGYTISPEVARAMIDRRLAAGETIDDIVADKAKLQVDILNEGIARHATLDPQQLIFMDRGLPDSIGYFNVFHLDTAPAVAASQQYRYRKIYILDALPLVHDNARVEDNETAALIGRLITQAYSDLGYDIVRIPVLTIDQRVDMILADIQT